MLYPICYLMHLSSAPHTWLSVWQWGSSWWQLRAHLAHAKTSSEHSCWYSPVGGVCIFSFTQRTSLPSLYHIVLRASSAAKQQHDSRFGASGGGVSSLICGGILLALMLFNPLVSPFGGVASWPLTMPGLFVLVSSVGSATCFARSHSSWVGGELMKNESTLVCFGFGSNVLPFLQAGTFQSCFDLILECSILFMQEYMQSCAAL